MLFVLIYFASLLIGYSEAAYSVWTGTDKPGLHNVFLTICPFVNTIWAIYVIIYRSAKVAEYLFDGRMWVKK